MTLRLTPDMLASGYDFLRETQPFKGWKLPPSDDVGFGIIRHGDRYADFGVEKNIPMIRVSETCVGHTSTLLAKLAHEICHLQQYRLGLRDDHGASFRRMARAVCRAHGWDPKTF